MLVTGSVMFHGQHPNLSALKRPELLLPVAQPGAHYFKNLLLVLKCLGGCNQVVVDVDDSRRDQHNLEANDTV